MERLDLTHSYNTIYIFSIKAISRYIWSEIESNSIYKAIITKDMLCVIWDGKVVKKV